MEGVWTKVCWIWSILRGFYAIFRNSKKGLFHFQKAPLPGLSSLSIHPAFPAKMPFFEFIRELFVGFRAVCLSFHLKSDAVPPPLHTFCASNPPPPPFADSSGHFRPKNHSPETDDAIGCGDGHGTGQTIQIGRMDDGHLNPTPQQNTPVSPADPGTVLRFSTRV